MVEYDAFGTAADRGCKVGFGTLPLGDESMRMRCLVTILVVTAIARSAYAQDVERPKLIPIPYRTYLSINPLGIPFDIYSAEVESGIAQGMTLGGSASHVDLGDVRYSSAEFKFRYYPGEVVLRGVSLGASAGVLRYSDLRGFGISGAEVRETLNAPTIGVILDYNWMLGAARRFVIGTGIGAKRVLASTEDRDRVGISRAQFSGRLTVGIAF
jgi:hypothetical protein